MATRFWTYENKLLLIMSLTFGFVLFDRMAINYLLPFMVPELGLTNTQIGMLASALSLTWALSGYVMGNVSDRTGKRKSILLIMLVVFSLCSFVSGLAGTFVVLLASRLIMGFAEGPVLPIAQSLMVLASSEHRRGFNMGVLQNCVGNFLGMVIAPVLLVAIANQWSWREAFFVAGLPGLITALFVARHVVEPSPQAEVSHALEHGHDSKKRLGLLDLFRERNIALCVAISCLMITWFVLIMVFLPVYLVQVRHISTSDMGVLMSVLGMSAVFSSMAVPALSDRVGRRPVMIAFSFVGVLLPLAAIHMESSNLFVYGAVLFVTYCALGIFPLFMATVPSETISTHYIATSLGLIMGAGELFGGFLAPTVAGMAADKFGLSVPMWIAAVVCVASGIIAMFLVETAPAVLAQRSDGKESGAGTAEAPEDAQGVPQEQMT